VIEEDGTRRRAVEVLWANSDLDHERESKSERRRVGGGNRSKVKLCPAKGITTNDTATSLTTTY
jgi:hypothetical protein